MKKAVLISMVLISVLAAALAATMRLAAPLAISGAGGGSYTVPAAGAGGYFAGAHFGWASAATGTVTLYVVQGGRANVAASRTVTNVLDATWVADGPAWMLGAEDSILVSNTCAAALSALLWIAD